MKRIVIWKANKHYTKVTIYVANEEGKLGLTMQITPPKGITKWERFCILKTDHCGKYLRKMKFNGKRPDGATIKGTASAIRLWIGKSIAKEK